MWTKIQFLLLAFHHCRGLLMPRLKKIEMAQGPVFIYLWVKLKPESREPSACYILSSKEIVIIVFVIFILYPNYT